MNNIFKENYFLDLFMEFYRILLNVQEKAKSKKDINDLGKEQLRKQLKDLLDKQSYRVSMTVGAFMYDSYRELQYALCGLADEQMLYLDWSGKEWWQAHLLETEFFGSHNAGEQVFINIDTALNNQSKYKQSILIAYLYLLSLGFLGKYNMQKDAKDVIQKYKQDIYFQLYQKDPIKTYQIENLFNDTLLYNMQNNLSYESMHAKKLLKRCGVILAAYCLISHFTWVFYVYPVTNLADNINQNIKILRNKNNIVTFD